MKQFLLCFCMISLLFFVFSCKNEVSIDNPVENPSDNPSEEDNKPVKPPSDFLPDDENDVVEDTEKTYLEITNNSQYDVNVYISSLDSIGLDIQAGTKVTKDVSTEKLKDNEATILIEYEYNMGSVTIPYFNLNNKGCKKIIPIYKNETNSLKLSELDSLSFDKTYLILQNKTSDYVYVSEFESEDISKRLTKYSSDDTWIKPETEALYDITNLNLDSCYVVNGDEKVRLNIRRLKSNRVYTVSYDGNCVSVLSVNLGLNPKDDKGLPIYTISSVEDLKNISKYDDVDATFELTQDIDGKDDIWYPISNYKGTLDGNGFSIKNFKINRTFSLDNQTACSGFILENKGTIKNIFFKEITIDSYWVEKSSEWRYLNVGTVASVNLGTIKNVHLEEIMLASKLNHSSDVSNDEVRQVNRTGGIIGQNKGVLNYCSIRNASITGSTDAKNNWCDAYTYVGGICGENTKECSNLLSVKVSINANLRGGYNWWMGGDGHFKAYLGNVLGGINETGNNSKIISYNNTTPKVTVDNLGCDNTTSEILCENISGINKGILNEVYSIKDFAELNSKSEIIYSWPNWSIMNVGPENYLD